MSKKRQTEADRLREIYQDWLRAEGAEARRGNLVLFADELGYSSHSAISDMLNGKRALAADVLRAARGKWGVSADWLLFGEGPKYFFEVSATEDLQTRVGEYIARRLSCERGSDLNQRQSVVIGSADEEVDMGAYLVDGKKALDSLISLASSELSSMLSEADRNSVMIEAVRIAQRIAVRGPQSASISDHAAFHRLLTSVPSSSGGDRILSRHVRINPTMPLLQRAASVAK